MGCFVVCLLAQPQRDQERLQCPRASVKQTAGTTDGLGARLGKERTAGGGGRPGRAVAGGTPPRAPWEDSRASQEGPAVKLAPPGLSSLPRRGSPCSLTSNTGREQGASAERGDASRPARQGPGQCPFVQSSSAGRPPTLSAPSACQTRFHDLQWLRGRALPATQPHAPSSFHPHDAECSQPRTDPF